MTGEHAAAGRGGEGGVGRGGHVLLIAIFATYYFFLKERKGGKKAPVDKGHGRRRRGKKGR